MSDDQHILTSDGSILSATDALVTLQFPEEAVPPPFSHLESDNGELCVIKSRSDGIVQALAQSGSSLWSAGQVVRNTGAPFLQPIEEWIAGNFPLDHADDGPVFETGIKAIDIFAPLKEDGGTAIFAEWGAGLLVLIPELLFRLPRSGHTHTFFAYVPPIQSEKQWREFVAEIPVDAGEIPIYWIPVADPLSEELMGRCLVASNRIVLTKNLSKKGIYPPLDPTRSGNLSDLPELRSLIGRYLVDQEGDLRAAQAAKFLSQPFYVAEPYTGIPGVSCNATAAGKTLADIAAGKYDGWSSALFWMAGDLPKSDL